MLRWLLKNHLQYGSCWLAPERENLFDKAKIWYRDNRGINPVLVSSALSVPTKEIKPKGWGPESNEKVHSFQWKTKKLLWRKIFLGQETAIKSKLLVYHKRWGTQKMRTELGGSPQMSSWLLATFNPSSPEWPQSSETDRRRSSKMTQQPAKNQAADILYKCQLPHPIAYDSFTWRDARGFYCNFVP